MALGARIVLALALLLPLSCFAFAPRSAIRPRAVKLQKMQLSSSVATAEKLVVADEPFPGVAECPLTAWGPRDIRIHEERAKPRYYGGWNKLLCCSLWDSGFP